MPPLVEPGGLALPGIAAPSDQVAEVRGYHLIAPRAVIRLLGDNLAHRPLAVVGQFHSRAAPGALQVQRNVAPVVRAPGRPPG